jgi:hypothetical protein
MKLERFFLAITIILSSFNVLQAVCFVWFVVKHRRELPFVDLFLTIFINFSTFFFAIILIAGCIKKDRALIITWLVYAFTKIVRSSISIYSSWKFCSNGEKKFNIGDLVLQVLLLIIVIFMSLKNKSKRKVQISTISRSISEVTVMETMEI